MRRDTVRQTLVLVSTVGVIVFNGLANVLPLNGLTTGEISDRFPVYFVPAGYVFSIWSLIFLGLLGLAIYQALPSQPTSPGLRRSGYFLVIANLANAAWLALWHYERFLLTPLAMLILLACLIGAYQAMQIGRRHVGRMEWMATCLPISMYLAWVCVAAISNAAVVLFIQEWDGWGVSAEMWAVIMVVVGAVVASLVAMTRRDAVFLAVFVWAYVGLAVRHPSIEPVYITALGSAGWLIVLIVVLALTGPARSGAAART
jgi:hypothetical protein